MLPQSRAQTPLSFLWHFRTLPLKTHHLPTQFSSILSLLFQEQENQQPPFCSSRISKAYTKEISTFLHLQASYSKLQGSLANLIQFEEEDPRWIKRLGGKEFVSLKFRSFVSRFEKKGFCFKKRVSKNGDISNDWKWVFFRSSKILWSRLTLGHVMCRWSGGKIVDLIFH